MLGLVALAARILELPLVATAPFARLDAIVVLGAPLGPGDTLTAALGERALAAARLYRAGGGAVVIACGGVTGAATRSEADVLADALVTEGVPRERIVIERASRTTLANAREAAPLLAACGATRVWIVTQPFHTRRAARAFRRFAGVDARAWHVEDSVAYRDPVRALRWAVREYAAWGKHLAIELTARRTA